MARKRKKTKHWQPPGGMPLFIIGLIAMALGLFLLTIALIPDQVGKLGTTVDSKFLQPYFGHGAIIPGLYAFSCGIVLLFLRTRWRLLIGLTGLMLVSLIVVDAIFFDEKKFKDTILLEPPEGIGVYLGYLIRDPMIVLIGKAGTSTLCFLVVIIALVIMLPLSVWKACWKYLTTKRQKATKPEITKTKPTTAKPKLKAPPVKESLETTETITPTIQLNLSLYDRDFPAPPHDLFTDQAGIDKTLPSGTRKQDIINAFASFDIAIDIGQIRRGPSFEQYEILPQKGVRLNSIRSVIDDISVRLQTKTTLTKQAGRILSLEVPLQERQVIPCGFLLQANNNPNHQIPIAVGVDTSFQPYTIDLAEMPHLLIAGTTGSGKSIFLKTLIASILYHLTPNEARLVLIDPKRVEFKVFDKTNYCALPVITNLDQVPAVFQALLQEMEQRYTLLEENDVSNIQQYNAEAKPDKRLPYLIVIVDEFADLILQNLDGVENAIVRLAQKARACGIHLVLATQRPSADIIKGLIKTNIPGRIALSVSSSIDSKIILDQTGAENLIGNGDLICISPNLRDGIRLQGAYITPKDIKKIIKAKK